jgi:hypothetical protein
MPHHADDGVKGAPQPQRKKPERNHDPRPAEPPAEAARRDVATPSATPPEYDTWRTGP